MRSTPKKLSSLLSALAFLMLGLATGSPAAAAPTSKSSEPTATPASHAPAPAASSAATASGAGVVNINDASSEQLQLLPGVGPSRAEAIVTFRKSHPFKRVDELTRIKGIGRKSLLRLRPLLTISGPTTLKERPGKPGSPLAHGRRPLPPPLT
ncbi:MAG TPA: helix-hairpin-helix domain-containing protein [Pseudomonadota bacterium]|nr:helix-hairpin-helix domain-containing protein [Pseudomonadota bacterium]